MTAPVLPDTLLTLLRGRATCYIATLMSDGSPQLTQTWVDTDGEHVVINTVQGFVKVRNVERDPRIALTVADPDDPSSFTQIRGRVVRTSTEGGAEHIEQLAQRYLGTSYPWFGGRDQVRVKLYIRPEHLHSPQG